MNNTNSNNNPLPWINHNHSSNNNHHNQLLQKRSLMTTTNKANNNINNASLPSSITTTSKNPLELEEEVKIYLENPKFADLNSILSNNNDHKNNNNNNSHSEEYKSHHLFSICKDPPGLSSYGGHTVITNTINKKLSIVIGIVVLILIVEFIMFRGKFNQQLAAAASPSVGGDHQSKSKKQVSFSKIDSSSELMSVFWSLIVIVVLAVMIQTFVVDYDSLTGTVTWSKYRFGFFLVSRRQFSVTAVRTVLAKPQSLASMKKKGGPADSSRQSFVIEISVTSMKSPVGMPGENLQVDTIVGEKNANEMVKCWVGFFQRVGANCEVGETEVNISSTQSGGSMVV